MRTVNCAHKTRANDHDFFIKYANKIKNGNKARKMISIMMMDQIEVLLTYLSFILLEYTRSFDKRIIKCKLHKADKRIY